ncbi:hypothetical protein IAT38_001960 [Cryptococcus sp. DSM 104549]
MAYFVKRLCTTDNCRNSIVGYSGLCSTCPAVFCVEHRWIDQKGGHNCCGIPLPDGSRFFLDNSRDEVVFDPKEIERRYGSRAGASERRGGVEGANVQTIRDLQFHYTLAWLDPELVVKQAQVLRPGHTCTLRIPAASDIFDAEHKQYEHKQYCTMNIHIPLIFDDGVSWMVRVRQYRTYAAPLDLQKQITESEVATQQLLRTHGIKVPMAWKPSVVAKDGHDGPIIDFYFMEYLEGRVHWSNDYPSVIRDDLALTYTRRFIESLARHFISISNVPLPSTVNRIGSVYPSDDTGNGGFTVGPLCTKGFMMDPHPPYFAGPFKTQRERYLAYFDRARDYIYLMEFEYIGIGLLNQYFWMAEVGELVDGCAELAREETEFFVKHGEDWLKQYLSDDEGNITGVVDWEWAYVTTKSEAFCAQHELASSDLHGMARLGPSLTEAELLLISAYERFGRPDLADCVRHGRLYQCLAYVVNSCTDPDVGDVNRLREVILGDQAGEPWETLEDWEMAMAEKYRSDPKAADLGWRLYCWGGKRWKNKFLLSLLKNKLVEEGEGAISVDISGVTSGEWVPPAYDECFQ